MKAKRKTRAKRYAEFTLEETILIVHAMRMALDTRTSAELFEYVKAMSLDLRNRFSKAPKEQVDELRSYARAS